MNQFWANESDAVWYIEGGSAMLYLASTDEAAVIQPRQFVCDVRDGCPVTGLSAILAPGIGLLCVPAPGTQVRRAALASLDALDAPSKARIEAWMRDVMRDVDPNGSWAAMQRKLIRQHTETPAVDSRVWHARVRSFTQMVVERIHERSQAAEAREAQRLLLGQNLDAAKFASAMGEISKGVLSDEKFGTRGPSDDEGDGLLAACRILESSRKVRFVSSNTATAEGTGDNETVEILAETSSARARQVLLDGAWWHEEGGPLLARLSENELPAGACRHWVALLPGPVSGYRLHSAKPIAGVKSGDWVTEAIAHRLSPFAYTFYRIFPKEKLTAFDVIKFGIEGKGKDVLVLLLASVLAGALSLLVPVVSGKIIDRVIPAFDQFQLWQYIIGLMVAGLSVLLFDTLRTVAVLRIEARAGLSVQAAILDRIISLPVTFFRRYSSGDLALRMAAVNSIQHAVTGSTIGTLLTSIFLVGNFALMLWYSTSLTLVVLVVIALLCLVSGIIGFARLLLARRLEELGGKLQSLVFEYLSGISKIRTSASEQRAFVNWTDRFLQFRRLHIRSESLANTEQLVLNILMPAMLLFVYYAVSMGSVGGTSQFVGSRFSTGDFIAFNAALFSLVGGMYGLMTTAIDLVQLLPVWERAKPIVETLPDSAGKRNERHEPIGGIEITNLGFRYPDGPPVLDNVNFTITPGAFVAIVGPSGSGKSTLIRLLLGFETPTSGSVCFDGHDLAALDTRHVRSRIGTVLQGGRLWPGDLYSNIAGTSNLPVEKVWEAARIAGLKNDIENMPMGLYTSISDGDSTLSGGQRQRILIARAVVHQPRILLLDEATAALDNVTQAIVQESLAGLKCTRLVIAHRLNTIRNADWILVMDQGKLAEEGTFDTLTSKQGVFSTMLRRQLV